MKLLKLFALAITTYVLMTFIGCTTPSAQSVIYQSIATTEAGVIAANAAYLDSVVTGITPTNSVPKVEAAFNDTQMALHTAASIASGGSSAPVSPAVFQKAVAFTNTINSVQGK